jgi:hypothetical protein
MAKDKKTIKDGKIYKRSIVEDLGKVLPFLPVGRIGSVASKVPGVKGFLKNIGDKVVKGARGASDKIQQRNTIGQGGGKFNPPTVRPDTSVVKKLNSQKKFSPQIGPNANQLANRAVVTTGLSELIKPKKVVAKEIKQENTVIKKPNKAPVAKVKTETLKKMGPTKDYTGKFVNKKGDVAYDSIGDFFSNITGTAKKRERPENRKRIQAENKGATKGVGFSGESVAKFKNPFKKNSGGILRSVPSGNKGLGKLPSPVRNKMGYMQKGGVVKMRGGGAAIRGINFNKGK